MNTYQGRLFNLALFAYHLFWQAVDCLYPPNCGGCGAHGSRWCPTCHSSTQVISDSICVKCGVPQSERKVCSQCGENPPSFKALRGWGVYDGSVRNAIHRLKYENDIGLADIFSKFLIEKLSELKWSFDLLIPVPLSTKRLKNRGYNQSLLLARPVALHFHSKLAVKALWRTRETQSQVELSAGERRINLIGAFEADSSMVKNKTVIIIDDLATTGATIQACSLALLKAGAKAIYGLTLARTPFLTISNKE